MPTNPLDEHLWSFIGRAYYNYLGLLTYLLEEHGLEKHVRPGMGHILFCLFDQEELIIKDIVARTQLSPSTLSGLLERMEKTGLIGRTRDPADGRAVRVRLTPLGRSLEPRCRLATREMNDVIRAALKPKEIEMLKDLMRRMTEALRNEEKARREAGKGKS